MIEGLNGITSKTTENILFGAGTIHKGLKYTTTKWNFEETCIGAKEPIGGISNINIEITPAGFLSLNFTKNEEGVSEGLTVTYEDLVSCGMLYGFPNNANIYNYYFGVALVKLNSSGQPTSTVYVLTQNSTMASFQAMGAGVTGIVTDDSFSVAV